MLTDFERQQCRDFKKRMDMAKTPAGKEALKMANAKKKEREPNGKYFEVLHRPATTCRTKTKGTRKSDFKNVHE